MKSFSILFLWLSCYSAVFMPTAVTSIVLCRLMMVVANAFQPTEELHWIAKMYSAHWVPPPIPSNPRKSLIRSSKARKNIYVQTSWGSKVHQNCPNNQGSSFFSNVCRDLKVAQCFTELPWLCPPFLLLRMVLYARLRKPVFSACKLLQWAPKVPKNDHSLILQVHLLPQTFLLWHRG